MTRSRAILAATSIAAALLIAGCDADPPPATPSPEPTTASQSPSASPSPTATAVVVAPERPKEMDDDGPAGAEAAAVYFLELDTYIMATGDTTEYESMALETCGFCANRVEQAQEIDDGDLTWNGGRLSARVTHTYEQDSATGIWPVDLDATISPTRVTDPSGEEVFSDDLTNTSYQVRLTRQDGQWRIVGVGDKQTS